MKRNYLIITDALLATIGLGLLGLGGYMLHMYLITGWVKFIVACSITSGGAILIIKSR